MQPIQAACPHGEPARNATKSIAVMSGPCSPRRGPGEAVFGH
jgi:hypothetical protein